MKAKIKAAGSWGKGEMCKPGRPHNELLQDKAQASPANGEHMGPRGLISASLAALSAALPYELLSSVLSCSHMVVEPHAREPV